MEPYLENKHKISIIKFRKKNENCWIQIKIFGEKANGGSAETEMNTTRRVFVLRKNAIIFRPIKKEYFIYFFSLPLFLSLMFD